MGIGWRKSRVYNEPIEMKERRHGCIPQAFLWHGHCYHIHAVERCWTDLGWRRDAGRMCFLVRCAEGTFELYQNLTSNTWHLHKALWKREVQAA